MRDGSTEDHIYTLSSKVQQRPNNRIQYFIKEDRHIMSREQNGFHETERSCTPEVYGIFVFIKQDRQVELTVITRAK